MAKMFHNILFLLTSFLIVKFIFRTTSQLFATPATFKQPSFIKAEDYGSKESNVRLLNFADSREANT
jgi:hypothetical protein